MMQSDNDNVPSNLDGVTVVSGRCKAIRFLLHMLIGFPDIVCALDSDVTFLSADGVLFYLHRKNLETNTGGFPPAEIETRNEIVSLTEDSSILELLFRFIYPAHHPKLDRTPFATLSLLAEAAEKYEVYSAMNVCSIRMQ